MTVSLLDLPSEILILILCTLDPPSILACSLTHSSLLAVIRNHQVVEYHIAKHLACVSENPRIARVTPVAERLALLKSRERAWATLKVDFTETVLVKHAVSGIYDVGGGVYLMGDRDRKKLHYLQLPSTKPAEGKTGTPWKKIEIDKVFVDMAFSIWEHDLIALVTVAPSTTQENVYVIELLLLQFSTGNPHPLAKNPCIRVCESPWNILSIGMEIVGDNLALVIFYQSNHLHLNDRFSIFDWKSGTPKLSVKVLSHTYTGLVFLTPSILLLPNMRRNTLDIWAVPSSPEKAVHRPLRALALPPISDLHFILHFSCRGEPNPVGGDEGMKYSQTPFNATAADAIVIFNLTIQSMVEAAAHSSYSFFVHRKALLALVPGRCDPPMLQADDEGVGSLRMIAEDIDEEAETMSLDEDEDEDDDGDEVDVDHGQMLSNAQEMAWMEVGLHGADVDTSPVDEDLAVDEDGSWNPPLSPALPASEAEPSTLVGDDATTPAPAPSSVSDTHTTQGGQDDEDGHGSFRLNEDHERIPPVAILWADWGGERITRWIGTDDASTNWITTTAGQRCVVYSEGTRTLSVLDFNLKGLGVGGYVQPEEREVEEEGDRGGEALEGGVDVDVDADEGERMVLEPSVMRGDMFEEPVVSSLPYRRYTVKGFRCGGDRDDETLEGVLMDEERLLGLKVDFTGRTKRVEIMHIGMGSQESEGE